MNNRRPPPNTEQPALSIDPRHLDFGDVWAERNYERVVHLTNTSESPLELLAIKGDCSCVSVGKLPPGLLPGASVAIPLTIDLTRAFESGKAVAEQKTNLTITVRAGTALKDQYATLTGRVRFPIQPVSPVLQIGLWSVRDTTGSRNLSISAIPEVARIEVAPTNQWAARVVRNAQNNTFQITASAVEPLQPRLVADELRIRLLDTSGQQVAVAPLRLEGELVADVLSDPRALYVAATRAGEVIRDEFRVRSLTGRTFRVQRFECPKGMSFRALRPSDFSSDHRVAVDVDTAVVNPPSGTAVLTVEHEDGTTSEVPVPYRVFGADANPLK